MERDPGSANCGSCCGRTSEENLSYSGVPKMRSHEYRFDPSMPSCSGCRFVDGTPDNATACLTSAKKKVMNLIWRFGGSPIQCLFQGSLFCKLTAKHHFEANLGFAWTRPEDRFLFVLPLYHFCMGHFGRKKRFLGGPGSRTIL